MKFDILKSWHVCIIVIRVRSQEIGTEHERKRCRLLVNLARCRQKVRLRSKYIDIFGLENFSPWVESILMAYSMTAQSSRPYPRNAGHDNCVDFSCDIMW